MRYLAAGRKSRTGLGEILPILVVLEQEYTIGIIQEQHDDCETQNTEEDVPNNHIQNAQ